MVAEKDDDDALLWKVVSGKRERDEGALDGTVGENARNTFLFRTTSTFSSKLITDLILPRRYKISSKSHTYL